MKQQAQILSWIAIILRLFNYNAINGPKLGFYGRNVTAVTIGNQVVTIPEELFEDNPITSLTIGNSVTTIGKNAFSFCDLLTSVTLPNSLKLLGENAFQECTSLQSLTIPENVEFINASFYNCTNLTTLVYKAHNSGCSVKPFMGCPITNLTISDGVQVIPDYFMSGMGTLTTLTMSNSVTRIGTCAFNDCNLSGDLELSNSLVEICLGAFNGNDGLTSVTIPGGVTNIPQSVFSDTNIDYVTMMPTTPPSVDWSAFSFNLQGFTFEVPCGRKTAYENAFATLLLYYPYLNIVEGSDCTYTIGASAVPAAGGTITGTGTYHNGDNVTLKATPKTHYVFEKWTENDETVSTNATYSFTCSGNRTLKAHFTYLDGVEESENESLAVYPNPTNGIFNVECDGMTEIEVYSCDGRLIQRVNTCDNSIQIDLTNLSSGIYNLNIITKDGSVRKSIIKM